MTVRLRGDRVTLRAFREGEFDLLWAQEKRDRGPFDAPRPDDSAERDRLRARSASSGSWHERGSLLLAIEASERLVGDLQARRSDDLLPPGVFEVGIGLFADARGKGYGTEALRLLTGYLFDEEHANRVQLGTDVDNVAMQRVAEHAGFTREGVMRGFWPNGEGPARDFALYARTRADHEATR